MQCKDIFFLFFVLETFVPQHHPPDLCALTVVFIKPLSVEFALEDGIFVSPSGQTNRKCGRVRKRSQLREQWSDFSCVRFPCCSLMDVV